ncbi:MAG: hypothetical protein ACXWZZ_06645 [Solirubrobacteraceae bacterium]
MSTANDALYRLLPAVHRTRDAHEGGDQLRALLAIVEEELGVLEADVARLYDDWFIETCQEWVVPYIGDLLGVRGLLPIEGAPFSQRGLVANTIAYRRAKGTAAVLEQLARDVTGWGARAVEYFDRLALTRSMNHRRRSDVAFADVRDDATAALAGTPFEHAAHLADVRHIDNGRGRYNLANVGLHLWRLQSYPLELSVQDDRVAVASTAREVATSDPDLRGRYTFSPLGYDLALFNVPRAEQELSHLAEEPNVAAPLRRRPLHDELEERRQARRDQRTDFREVYFDDSEPVFQVAVKKANGDREVVAPEQIAICDLRDSSRPPKTGWRRPENATVGIDPELGRLALPAGVTYETVEVGYAYGFPGDLGGGPYDRSASVAQALPLADLPAAQDVPRWQKGVTALAGANDAHLFSSLAAAVTAWNAVAAPAIGVIAVMDSRSYEDDLSIEVPAGSRLLIVAADWPFDEAPEPELAALAPQRRFGRLTPRGRRPHIGGRVEVRGVAGAPEAAPGELAIDGLLLEQPLTVLDGDLGRLRIAHCTLAPESAHVDASAPAANGSLTVELERTICGPVSLAASVPRLQVRESIVDAGGGEAIVAPHSDADVQAATIVGATGARTLTAGNSIFTEAVRVKHRQTGCVRYCYLPLASVVARRFRCHPRDEAAAARVSPAFTSLDLRTGPSAYGQLATSCPPEIARGAEDEGELGALHFLKNAQRQTNLTIRMDEYLRFGLEAGLVFVT